MKFNYKVFKKEMENRGHEIHKHGKYITIIPNNNYIEYAKGFLWAEDIIDGFEIERLAIPLALADGMNDGE